MISLDPRVDKSLRDAHDALALRGELISADRMRTSYAAFRSRFGPDELKALDGLLRSQSTAQYWPKRYVRWTAGLPLTGQHSRS